MSFLLKYKNELLVMLCALGMGIYAYYPSLVNEYRISDDARICVYWASQYSDPELFQNDFLTKGARYAWPWGFIFLYYISSFLVQPLLFGTLLTIFLVILSALYLFKLGRHIQGNFTGFLAAALFLITQTYVSRMAGGLPRSFGYPLLIIFIYYLVRKDHVKAGVLMILQCLFYPIIFPLSGLTFAFSVAERLVLSRFDWKANKKTIVAFIGAAAICFSIVLVKQYVSYDSDMGRIYTKTEMADMIEFYRHTGRWDNMFPLRTFFQDAERHIMESNLLTGILIRSTTALKPMHRLYLIRAVIWLLFLLVAVQSFRKKVRFPAEVVYLMLSSGIMFQLAKVFLFHLYVPNRYAIYPSGVVALCGVAAGIACLTLLCRNAKVRTVLQILIIGGLISQIGFNHNQFLINETKNQELYKYLETLPKDAVIAAYPYLSDNIPTFSKRIVYVSDELAVPMYKTYWEEVKRRLFLFYSIYYSNDPMWVYNQCVTEGIDYLVVRLRDFHPEWLQEGKPQFEPFNTFVRTITMDRKDFILIHTPKELRTFEKDHIFVIHRDALVTMGMMFR